MIPQDDFSAFFEGYTACALWSSTDDGGTPLDANYGELDLSGMTRKRFEEDCRAFCEQNLEDLTAVARGSYTWASAGHDFWLTRNGHGAGFWDRGDAPEWDRLDGSARGFGVLDLYVGGDNFIYAV